MSSASSQPFIVEVQGSVSQRLYRYDTEAAAESTHQSRADYIRRKQAVVLPPSWTQHAATNVPGIHEVKHQNSSDNSANNNNSNSNVSNNKKREIRTRGASGMTSTLSLTPLGSQVEIEAHAAALKMLQQRDDPPRGNCILPRKSISASTTATSAKVVAVGDRRGEDQGSKKKSPVDVIVVVASDQQQKKGDDDDRQISISPEQVKSVSFGSSRVANKETHAGTEPGTIKIFNFHGVETIPQNEQDGQKKANNNKSLVSNKNDSLTRAPRAREAAPTAPLAIGDILGKSTNITQTMISQRSRFEKLEEERLKKMRSDLVQNGWEQSVSPGGPSKRIGDRIYAGLPKRLNDQEQKVYDEYFSRQQEGYYGKK